MRRIKIIYLLLLAYIIVAIIFWGHNLQEQNILISKYEIELAQQDKNKLISNAILKERLAAIEQKKQSRTRQYIGEGVTFLLIIFFGAFIVYSSIRRQKKLALQQRNFILSITHELKTPIAGVKLNLQTLLRPNVPEDKKKMLLDRAIGESNRLNDLCNNLLLAAKMEDKGHNTEFQELNLSALVEDSVKTFESRYNISILNAIKENVHLNGDAKLLSIVINNLLENAIKYNKDIHTIAVSLDGHDDDIILQVKDNGIGIQEEYKKKVFQKFYRIGNEDTRNTKGTGLGLFLTNEIVKLHGGTISILDNEPKGSIFEIIFRLSK